MANIKKIIPLLLASTVATASHASPDLRSLDYSSVTDLRHMFIRCAGASITMGARLQEHVDHNPNDMEMRAYVSVMSDRATFFMVKAVATHKKINPSMDDDSVSSFVIEAVEDNVHEYTEGLLRHSNLNGTFLGSHASNDNEFCGLVYEQLR